MNNQPAIIVVGGGIIGILLAVAISTSLTDGKISAAMERASGASEEMAAAAAAVQEDAMAALDARMAGLEASLSETAAAAGETAEGVAAQMSALKDDLAARIETLDTTLAGMSAPEAPEVAEDAPAAGGAAPTMAGGAPVRVGQTVLLAEGAVRVFVSRVDTEQGSARLSVNGTLSTLDVGAATPVTVDGSECQVMLVSVSAAGASLGSDCTDGTAVEAAAPDLPAAPEEGFRPGEVALLVDGALRVFVSGMAEDGSAARLAINGVDLQVVSAGETVEVMAGDQTCTLSVTGVGNGMVGLEGDCG